MDNKDTKWILQYYLMEHSDDFSLESKDILNASVDQLLDMIPMQESEESHDWLINKLREKKQEILNKREIAKKEITDLIAKKEEGQTNPNAHLKLSQQEIDEIDKEIIKRQNILKVNYLNTIKKLDKMIKDREDKWKKGFWSQVGMMKDDVKTVLSKIYAKHPTAIKAGSFTILGVALLSLVSIALYKMYFTPAQVACRSSKNKTQCIREYKRKAIEQVIQKLEQEKSMCSNSIRPDLCNRRLDEEIDKWERKLSKV